MTIAALPSLSIHARPAVASAVAHRLRALLDRTSDQLDALDLSGMNDFVHELDRVRLSVHEDVWPQLIAEVIAPHRILEQLHQEPFTRRAFEKPRGYAGDAPMLDLAYRDRPYSVQLTRLGAALHAWLDGQPSAVSVRERLTILADAIDTVAGERNGARVLSLACGHLREAQLSDAVRRGAISELVALDQDTESLAVVEREQAEFNVRAQRASVKRFVTSVESFGTFDLSYSAGLYDYLPDRDAMAVTAALFRSLRSGGRMIIANFAPELRDIAYLEAIMEWRLIYRDEEDVMLLTDDIPQASIASMSTSRDSLGNVVYLTIDRA